MATVPIPKTGKASRTRRRRRRRIRERRECVTKSRWKPDDGRAGDGRTAADGARNKFRAGPLSVSARGRSSKFGPRIGSFASIFVAVISCLVSRAGRRRAAARAPAPPPSPSNGRPSPSTAPRNWLARSEIPTAPINSSRPRPRRSLPPCGRRRCCCCCCCCCCSQSC